MARYNAGEAEGLFTLNDAGFQQAKQRILQGFAQIEAAQARAQQTRAAPGGNVANTQAATLAQQRLATETQRTARETNNAATAAQKLQTETQRTTRATTDAARAEQLLARDTANAAAAQDRAATAALRRQQAQERAARASENGGLGPALPRTFAGFTAGGLTQAAGAFGLATLGPQLVGQAIGAGVEAAKASLELEKTKRTLQAVAGDTHTYADAVKLAREQQQLFGGTLSENIEGLTGLQITARQSGADLRTLVDLSQRLGTLDPAQGVQGARIALSEALSGDPTSLAKRYEIPRAELAKLRDESISTADKLAVIDQYLNKVGITSETTAGAISDQQRVFNGLNAELDTLKTNVGGGLANAFTPAAEGLGRLVGLINNNPEAIAKLEALVFGKPVTTERIADITREQQRQQAVQVQAQASGGALRPETFGDGFDAFLEALTDVQSGTDAQKQSAADLIQLWADEAITAQVLASGVQGLADQVRGVNDAEDRRVQTINATRDAQAELIAQQEAAVAEQQKAIETSLAEGQAKDLLNTQTDIQKAKLDALAQSFIDLHPNIGAAGAASILAAQNVDTATTAYILQTLKIAGARAELARLQAQAGMTPTERTRASGRDGGLLDRTGTDTSDEAAETDRIRAEARASFRADQERRAQAAQADAKRIADAQFQYELSKAKDAAGEIALYKKRLAQTTDQEERLRLQTQINNLEQQQTRAATKRKADPNARGLSGLDRTRIDLAGDEAAQLDEVNRQLAAGNLTEQQRNQLILERQKLEESITDEKEKQLRASVDAQLGAVQDAQKRLKEAREAAGLQRALSGGRLSGEQQQAAQLRLSEIGLEQQKRALDIQKDIKTAGGVLPGATPSASAPAGITPPLPLPNVGALPPLPGAGALAPITVNIAISVDKDGTPRVTSSDPGVVLNLLGTAAGFRNLSGG